MPKVNKLEKSKPKSTEKKQCEKCKKELVLTNFYNTNNILSDGKAGICKTCMRKMINYNDIQTIYDILQGLDLPFFYNSWARCKELNSEDPWSPYIRMANSNINEFKGCTWSDSDFQPQLDTELNYDESLNTSINDNFIVTQDMIKRWGIKHDPEDYITLENFYHDMKISNNIETAQDMVYLKKLAIISLKMDKALEEGHYGEAKQLGDLFSKYMADSKFRAMDKTEADKTGGIRNFSSIYVEVEKDGFIPPWEYYRKIKGITQDIVDKTIMHIENFTLKLNKIEKMTIPPVDTPKLDDIEIDYDSEININDIDVDLSDDTLVGES